MKLSWIEANVYHDAFEIHKSLLVKFLFIEQLYTPSMHIYIYVFAYIYQPHSYAEMQVLSFPLYRCGWGSKILSDLAKIPQFIVRETQLIPGLCDLTIYVFPSISTISFYICMWLSKKSCTLTRTSGLIAVSYFLTQVLITKLFAL